ncbi:class I SAM-dependent methyltransferase [Ekhidna sp.]
MENSFKEVEWSAEKISKFWDFIGSNTSSKDHYFSKMMGDGIINKARKSVPLKGKFLDMGCGPGFFTEHLLNAGIDFIAMDSSPDSITKLQERYPSVDSKVGSLDSIPTDDDCFDGIFLIEVMEHLGNDYLQVVLKELKRVIKKNGYLIATVPFAEDLRANHVVCPECDHHFHRMQHLQSYTEQKMSTLISNAGFEPVLVKALNFKDYKNKSINKFIRLAKKLPLGLDQSTPHLLTIARHP